jgi:uncharacterized Fe-S center protein
MTKIYHSKEYNKEFLERLKEEIKNNFRDCKRIAIKIHFGEPRNKTSLKPEDIEPITNILKKLNIEFFFFDSSVTYHSPRNNPEEHKKLAEEKGWDKIGRIRSSDEYVKVKGENLTYEVCKELGEADGVLIISHFKGHICAGFGGAIKNLGMGALTQNSKNAIHEGGEPVFEGECDQCKSCEIACPLETLKVTDKPEFGECYGCSNCTFACPKDLIRTRLKDFDTLLADGATAAQSTFKKKYYVTFIINITKLCDCVNNTGGLIGKDAGYLMSPDGVAIDKASYDIIVKEQGDIFLKNNKKTGLGQVTAAERLGMGKQEYKLINL